MYHFLFFVLALSMSIPFRVCLSYYLSFSFSLLLYLCHSISLPLFLSVSLFLFLSDTFSLNLSQPLSVSPSIPPTEARVYSVATKLTGILLSLYLSVSLPLFPLQKPLFILWPPNLQESYSVSISLCLSVSPSIFPPPPPPPFTESLVYSVATKLTGILLSLCLSLSPSLSLFLSLSLSLFPPYRNHCLFRSHQTYRNLTASGRLLLWVRKGGKI